MVSQLSLQTARQSLVFFPHQAVSHRHLYDNIADARQAHDIAIGEALGRFFKRVFRAMKDYRRRQRVRDELLQLDDRMLADIGLTRGDIENVVSGRMFSDTEPEQTRSPNADVPLELPAARSGAVDAIMRRAA